MRGADDGKGNTKLENGNWKVEIRNSNLESAICDVVAEFPVSNFQFPISSFGSYESVGVGKEKAILHGVMFAVMCPEGEFVNRSGGGDQGVAQFDTVAFGELPQVVARPATDFRADRNARKGTEQRLEDLVFVRPRSMPYLRHGHR